MTATTSAPHPVEFFGYIDSGYPNIPHGSELETGTVYIDLPNTTWDPVQGQRNLETQLEMLARLEKFGLDGAMFSEQHNGPIGSLPNPLMGAAWLAARTERIKIVVGGPLLNAYQSPIRLAEEIALADVMSRGRLVVGLPMGLGQQYHSLGMNPAKARDRHREGHDLLVKALREDGPFTWRGEHFNHNYVNIWPRPMHEIEFIMPSGGSLETLELAAKRRYSYQTVLNYRPAMIATMERFRELCRAEGYEPEPKQSMVVVDIHVAETDEIALQEVGPRLLWNHQNYLNASTAESFPAGYTSQNSIRSIIERSYGQTKDVTVEELINNDWSIAGSPETVRAGLETLIADTGAGRVVLNFSFGNKPRWLLEKTITLFAEQVLPFFRPAGRPLDADRKLPGYDTYLEYESLRRKDAHEQSILIDGELHSVDRRVVPGIDSRIHPKE